MKDKANVLFDAAHRNDVEEIKNAIVRGADPNAQHPRAGTIPLQMACQGNALDAINALIALGANPALRFTRTSRVDGRTFIDHTPLMYVESEQAARLLVDAGADLDPQDERGWTPLARAAFSGNFEVAKYLRSRGAALDIEVKYDGRSMRISELVDVRIEDVRSAIEEQQREDLVETLNRLHQVRAIL